MWWFRNDAIGVGARWHVEGEPQSHLATCGAFAQKDGVTWWEVPPRAVPGPKPCVECSRSVTDAGPPVQTPAATTSDRAAAAASDRSAAAAR